jgi:hypothetical protein
LIIVSFVEDFSSGGGAAIIVPTVVMATTHPSRIERARDQAVAWVHPGFRWFPYSLIVIPTGTQVENFLLVQVWFSPRNQSEFYLVSLWCCWLSWCEVLLSDSNYLFLGLLIHCHWT